MEPGYRGIDGTKRLQTNRFPGQAGSRRETSKAGGRSCRFWQQNMPICKMFLAGATGLEPATSGVTGRSWCFRAERGSAGIPCKSSAFRPRHCGGWRLLPGASGVLLRDERGMRRCLNRKRTRSAHRMLSPDPLLTIEQRRGNRGYTQEVAGTKAPQEERIARRRVTACARPRPRWCSLRVPSLGRSGHGSNRRPRPRLPVGRSAGERRSVRM